MEVKTGKTWVAETRRRRRERGGRKEKKTKEKRKMISVKRVAEEWKI